MPVSILIHALGNHSDGRGKYRSWPFSISALLFSTNFKKGKKPQDYKSTDIKEVEIIL